MGSRLDPWCLLLDFFFLAAVVVGADVEEPPGVVEALDCCGLGATVAMLVASADVELAWASDARNSAVRMGSLLIFLRFSSLPRAADFGDRSVRRAYIPYYGDFPRGLKLGHPRRRVSSNRHGL